MTVGEYFKKISLPIEMRTEDQAERYIEGTYNPHSLDIPKTMNAVLYLIGECDHELMCTGRGCWGCPYHVGKMKITECRKNRLQHIKDLYNRRRRVDIETML